MKKTKKIVALLVMLAMVIACAFSVAACTNTTTPHGCEHVCEVCGKCTSECDEPECEDKCEGHTPAVEHKCEDKCPTCNKCTSDCTDPKCTEKCPGHEVEKHECKHVCPTCSKCTSNCQETECTEKCPGHTPAVEHECKHVCEVCNKCTSDCDKPECTEKCPGNHEPAAEHECEHVCEVCQKCTTECGEPECADKCPGNHEPAAEHECEHVCEVCQKCTSNCDKPECTEKCPGNHEPEEKHECESKCEVCDKCTSDCNKPECEEKCPGDHEPEEDEEYTVTFDLCGQGNFTNNELEDAKTVNGKLTSLPDVTPTGTNVRFLGWYTTAEGEGEKITTDYEFTGEDKEVTVYARYRQEYVITLNPAEGTLAAGAKTTYVTVDGKLTETLPEPTDPAHMKFDNWYNGSVAVDEETTVFTKDTEIVAKYVRENGVWKTDGTWVIGLSKNNGNTEAGMVEYWLGSESAKVNLTEGDNLNLYIGGKLCTQLWITGLGVKTEVQPKPSVVEVTQTGEFMIFLKDYSNGAGTNYVVEFRTDTKGQEGSEDDIPVGAGKITVKIGSLKDITIYLVKANGDPVKEEEFSQYCIYTFSADIFGDWGTSTTKGVIKSEMTASGSAVPKGWIFRWGSNYGTQTANIEGVIKEGGTYVIKLPAANNGAAEVTVIS